ncbi:MAG: hypothetical protein WAW60_00320 [Candidatus Saccharimonadales bacterium]
MKLKTPAFSAITVQYLLIALCLILVGGIVFISIKANEVLSAKATEVDHVHSDAELAQQELVGLKSLQSNLKENADVVAKTNEIVSIAKQYKFQDQVIKELSAYAQKSGVEIIGYDFGSTPGSKVIATPTQGAAPAPTTNANVPPKTKVVVRLRNDISYNNFLKFLMSIEQNLTKMQLTGITLQPIDKNPSNVQGPVIELEVFIL